MAEHGVQRRNRSCVSGTIAHCFEYYYTGDLAKDVIVTVDIFIDSSSDHHDRSGPKPNNFEVVRDSVGRAASPDQCFEFVGIFQAVFTMKDLYTSVFCRPEGWPDLFSILRSSDLVTDVLDKTALSDITGVYCVYKPLGLDNTDQLHLIILFK